METTQEKEVMVIPTPVNRGIIVENPAYDIISQSTLDLMGKEEEVFKDKLKAKFPNGIFKYTVLAVADNVSIPIKKGDEVVLNLTATHRTQPINLDDKGRARWYYITEGDIAMYYGKHSR